MLISKTKKVFGVFVIVVISLYISIWTFVLPFLYRYYWNFVSYTIVTAIALLILLLVNIIGNTALIAACLHPRSVFKDTYTYMFVYVGVVDILFDLLSSALIMLFLLIHLTQAYFSFNLDAYHIAMKASSAIKNGLEAISIIGFTGYIAMNLLKVHSVWQAFLRRMVAIFSSLIFLYGLMVSVLNYVFFDDEWQHVILSIANLFFPLFVWTMLLVLSFFFNRLRGHVVQISNATSMKTLYIIGGAYIIFNAPFYITYMVDTYCCRIDWEERMVAGHITSSLRLINTITTPIILWICENRFRETIFRLCTGRLQGSQYVVSFNQDDDRAHIVEMTDDEESLEEDGAVI